MRAMNPPVAPESTVNRKRRRYISWSQEPSKIKSDMQAYRNAVSQLQREFHVVESDENRWLNSLEIARRSITENMYACKVENDSLLNEGKKLETLCVEEIGLGSTSTRRKKNTFVRELVSELNGRQGSIENLVEQYERLINELSTKIPKDRMPTLDLVLDEVTGNAYVAPPVLPPSAAGLTPDPVAVDSDAPSIIEMVDNSSSIDGPVTMEADNAGSSLDHVAVASAFPVQPRRSLRSSEEISAVDEATDDADDDPNDRVTNLFKLFLLVDEKLRASEASLAEVDTMFPEEDEDWVFTNEYLPKSKSKSSVTTDPLKSKWAAFPEHDTEQKLTEPYLLLKKEASWSKLLESLCTGSTPIEALAAVSGTRLPHTVTKAISQRRKKRSISGAVPSAIPLTSFLIPRTPRGVPLLVSPLSQHPDRMLGSVFGAGSLTTAENFVAPKAETATVPIYSAERLSVPSEVVKSENGVIQRCGLLSATLSAENKLKRLMSSAEEWRKIAENSEISLTKARMIYALAMREKYMETRRCRKELVLHGLAQASSDEMPMSPISHETAAFFPHSFPAFTALNAQVLGQNKFAKKPINKKPPQGGRGLPSAATDILLASASSSSSSVAPIGTTDSFSSQSSNGNEMEIQQHVYGSRSRAASFSKNDDSQDSRTTSAASQQGDGEISQSDGLNGVAQKVHLKSKSRRT